MTCGVFGAHSSTAQKTTPLTICLLKADSFEILVLNTPSFSKVWRTAGTSWAEPREASCLPLISNWKVDIICWSTCVVICFSWFAKTSVAGSGFSPFLGAECTQEPVGSKGLMGIYSYSSSYSKALSCRSLCTICNILVSGLCNPNFMWVPTHDGFSVTLYMSDIGAAVRNSTWHSVGSLWLWISPTGLITSPKRNAISSGVYSGSSSFLGCAF